MKQKTKSYASNPPAAGGMFDDPNGKMSAGPDDGDRVRSPRARASKPAAAPKKDKASRKHGEVEEQPPVVKFKGKGPKVNVVIVDDGCKPPLTPEQLNELTSRMPAPEGKPLVQVFAEEAEKAAPAPVQAPAAEPTAATREAWLLRAVGLMTPHFEAKGYKVPTVRVSCGWPSVKGLAAKKRRIGECWDKDASKDGVHQIFISPFLDQTMPDGVVLATLVHEVVHAVVGLKEKHGKLFRKCALAVGLEGKMTETCAGPELQTVIKGWEECLGPYPHAQLDTTKRPTKKQSTRMIKCECAECGFTVRTTRKWLDDVGAPHCPKHGEMKFELPPELDTDKDVDDDGGEGE